MVLAVKQIAGRPKISREIVQFPVLDQEDQVVMLVFPITTFRGIAKGFLDADATINGRIVLP